MKTGLFRSAGWPRPGPDVPAGLLAVGKGDLGMANRCLREDLVAGKKYPWEIMITWRKITVKRGINQRLMKDIFPSVEGVHESFLRTTGKRAWMMPRINKHVAPATSAVCGFVAFRLTPRALAL